MYADSNHAIDQPFVSRTSIFDFPFLLRLLLVRPPREPRDTLFYSVGASFFVTRARRRRRRRRRKRRNSYRDGADISIARIPAKGRLGTTLGEYILSKRHFGCWSWRYALFRVRALIYALALQILQGITTAKMLHRYTSHSALKKFVSFIVQSWVKVDACN